MPSSASSQYGGGLSRFHILPNTQPDADAPTYLGVNSRNHLGYVRRAIGATKVAANVVTSNVSYADTHANGHMYSTGEIIECVSKINCATKKEVCFGNSIHINGNIYCRQIVPFDPDNCDCADGEAAESVEIVGTLSTDRIEPRDGDDGSIVIKGTAVIDSVETGTIGVTGCVEAECVVFNKIQGTTRRVDVTTNPVNLTDDFFYCYLFGSPSGTATVRLPDHASVSDGTMLALHNGTSEDVDVRADGVSAATLSPSTGAVFIRGDSVWASL